MNDIMRKMAYDLMTLFLDSEIPVEVIHPSETVAEKA